MSTIKDVIDISEPNICITKNWWSTNGRYIILGVITFLVLLLFFYVYKMLKSFSRQLHHLTDIISDQQERLNLHSKLLFNSNVEENVYQSTENPKLSLKDIHLSNCGDKIDQLFHLSNTIEEVPIVEELPIVDEIPTIDIEDEIADEIKELEESAHKITTDNDDDIVD